LVVRWAKAGFWCGSAGPRGSRDGRWTGNTSPIPHLYSTPRRFSNSISSDPCTNSPPRAMLPGCELAPRTRERSLRQDAGSQFS
jgi:hypothetical protein